MTKPIFDLFESVALILLAAGLLSMILTINEIKNSIQLLNDKVSQPPIITGITVEDGPCADDLCTLSICNRYREGECEHYTTVTHIDGPSASMTGKTEKPTTIYIKCERHDDEGDYYCSRTP